MVTAVAMAITICAGIHDGKVQSKEYKVCKEKFVSMCTGKETDVCSLKFEKWLADQNKAKSGTGKF